jgi:hypothetical protein
MIPLHVSSREKKSSVRKMDVILIYSIDFLSGFQGQFLNYGNRREKHEDTMAIFFYYKK